MIGVAGDKALVLSCRHVCRKEGQRVTAKWLWAGGQVTRGSVVHVMGGRGYPTDLALVVVDRPMGVAPVLVGVFDSRDGPWITAGFKGQMMRIGLAYTAKREPGLVFTYDPAVPGMSGGPAFNRFGWLIGVVVASDWKDFTVSVTGPQLIRMLDRFRR